MRIEKFLQEHVEGYLFHDLKNMADIRLRPGEPHGAAGYPMVLTVLSGIELLGGLLSADPFSKKKGDKYFSDYWENYIAKVIPAYAVSGLASLVYNLVRHGLAHTFATKVGIIVRKFSPIKHFHLKTSRMTLEIDAIEFYKDFECSYRSMVRLLVFGTTANSAMRNRMQQRLEEMISEYEIDRQDYFSKLPSGQSQSVAPPIIHANTEGSRLAP